MVIAETGVLPGNGHDRGNAAGRSRQQIRLQGQSIAVSATHLHGGFHTGLLQGDGPAERTHAHDRIAHFWYQEGIDLLFDTAGVFDYGRDICAFGGFHFGQNNKFAGLYLVFEMHRVSSGSGVGEKNRE